MNLVVKQMQDKVKDREESGAGFLFLTFWQTSRIIFLRLLNLGMGSGSRNRSLC